MTGRMRVGGAIFLLSGAALVWIGVYLFSGIRHWRITPDGAGLAALWLLVTGAMGGRMLATGQRPRWLLWAFVGLMAVLVGAGIVVTLQSGGRMLRLLRQAAFVGFHRGGAPLYPAWFDT
ncbi:hypothetical protein [Tabrizicola aquatica]|uniref:hypothetical protein n=1 Tax=Tabrizicola aquatica TaxID=909926 RepID=UPI000CD2D136|nr:hypothetical protein [Tabrizicola aquatica]